MGVHILQELNRVYAMADSSAAPQKRYLAVTCWSRDIIRIKKWSVDDA